MLLSKIIMLLPTYFFSFFEMIVTYCEERVALCESRASCLWICVKECLRNTLLIDGARDRRLTNAEPHFTNIIFSLCLFVPNGKNIYLQIYLLK